MSDRIIDATDARAVNVKARRDNPLVRGRPSPTRWLPTRSPIFAPCSRRASNTRNPSRPIRRMSWKSGSPREAGRRAGLSCKWAIIN
jgi:hypothetical protein